MALEDAAAVGDEKAMTERQAEQRAAALRAEVTTGVVVLSKANVGVM